MVELSIDQLDAIKRMHNGCILNGQVGSGKSRTAIAYYYMKQGGIPNKKEMVYPVNLYIITTARKRDTCDWEKELTPFLITSDEKISIYNHKVVIDSWNNIQKYKNVTNAFFIFDEQRVVGYGSWSKVFIKIAQANKWILLSATPGDSWTDYIPVFIANGFYKNKTEFVQRHVIYKRFAKYPAVDRIVDTGRLVRLRNNILVNMDDKRKTIPHHEDIWTEFDIPTYKNIIKTRWNIYNDEPFKDAAGLCYCLRKFVNSDESRAAKVLEIFESHPRVIIFYSYDYELDILRSLYYGENVEIAEWNGHKHQPIPDSTKWVYLVNYTAGAEGWNCIKTDTIIFYSQNYSYKMMAQASGRIDRMNTPYTDLYYYHLKSHASIDLAINKALKNKKKFNEIRWSGARVTSFTPYKERAN